MTIKTSLPAVVLAGILAATSLPATAAPLALLDRPVTAPSTVTKAQFGVYIGTGRPYRGYGYRYGPRYGRGWGYGPRRYYGGYPYYAPRPYVVTPRYRRWDRDDVARCASRFRSFNASSGTYTTYDGETRLCPYLR